MKFEQLKEFITNKMRMSHVYQPLMIRSLVDSGGSATLRQLAQSFVIQDESQLLYYEKRIKDMPLKVLTKHGVVEYQKGLVSLTTGHLSLEQRAVIRMICEQKLQEYIKKKSLSIWDYSLLDTEPVPGDLRFQILKNSEGRCELCGATKKERSLHIDHIIPRSKSGKTDPDNLQVLCSKCNCTKGNKDKTDYRRSISPAVEPNCCFCSPDIDSHIIKKNETVVAITDKYPVTKGHILVLPVRHTPDFFSMTSEERGDAEGLIRYLRNKTKRSDPSVTGFNIGTNCGEVAGQTVMHAHLHLIPRRKGDTPNPEGGVRGVIPGKMAY